VISNGDAALAKDAATEFGQAIYDKRNELLPRFPKVDKAVTMARESNGCVVMADTADNAGGGAPSDNISLLKAMLDGGTRDAVFGCIWDPIAVQACAEAGVGATLPLRIGGKCGPASGEAIDIIATVKAFREHHDQQGLGPARVQMGESVWIETGGIDVVLMSKRTQTFSPDAFTGLGIDLKNKRVIAVKSSWHFQALFGPMADQIVPVSTPGAIQMDFAGIDYKKKRDQDFFPRTRDPLGRG
jgi:microcystin degradation protein MlrC